MLNGERINQAMMKGRRKANLEPAWIFPRELLSAYFDSCIKFGGVINGFVLSRNVGTMRVDDVLQQRCTLYYCGSVGQLYTQNTLVFHALNMPLLCRESRDDKFADYKGISSEAFSYKLPFSEANIAEDTLRCATCF